MSQETIVRPVVVCNTCGQTFLKVIDSGLCPDCFLKLSYSEQNLFLQYHVKRKEDSLAAVS